MVFNIMMHRHRNKTCWKTQVESCDFSRRVDIMNAFFLAFAIFHVNCQDKTQQNVLPIKCKTLLLHRQLAEAGEKKRNRITNWYRNSYLYFMLHKLNVLVRRAS